MEVTSDSPEVSAALKQGPHSGMETVVVTVDSGAYNTVGPARVGAHLEVAPTESSRAGHRYNAANGSVITSYGQRVNVGNDDSGTPVSLPIRVADVREVLGSVREMGEAKNRIAFDMDKQGRYCGYVECEPTGQTTSIYEKNGTFQFNIQVPKGNGGGVPEVMTGGAVATEGFPPAGILPSGSVLLDPLWPGSPSANPLFLSTDKGEGDEDEGSQEEELDDVEGVLVGWGRGARDDFSRVGANQGRCRFTRRDSQSLSQLAPPLR